MFTCLSCCVFQANYSGDFLPIKTWNPWKFPFILSRKVLAQIYITNNNVTKIMRPAKISFDNRYLIFVKIMINDRTPCASSKLHKGIWFRFSQRATLAIRHACLYTSELHKRVLLRQLLVEIVNVNHHLSQNVVYFH